MISPRLTAVLQALLVTLIWSVSWVLIKIGLQGIPPLTFAGLRYTLAFGCLLIFGLRSPIVRQELRQLESRDWRQLIGLGLVFYTLTQGAQFAGLAYLPSATLSLLLNLTPVVVAGIGILTLGERPSRGQSLGIGLLIIGVLVYFYPASFPAQQVVGLAIGVAGMLANALASILGRSANRNRTRSPYTVTIVSMGVGSLVLLLAGLAVEGLPVLGLRDLAIIIWLAVVHTALAFTLWNHTLRTLTAVESSVINGTMLIQIAVLAWVFLGEAISPQGLLGLALAAVGVLVVQLSRRVVHNSEAE